MENWTVNEQDWKNFYPLNAFWLQECLMEKAFIKSAQVPWADVSGSWWTVLKAVKVKVAQSYPTLCDAMDYTVHGIL